MKEAEKLRQSLRSFFLSSVPVQIIRGTVSSVDWDAKTIEVSDGKVDYYDVLLSPNGSDFMVQKPKEGAQVLIGTIENKEAAKVLLMCEEFEELQLSGKDNGGLIIIQKLVDEINDIKKVINKMKSTYTSHTHDFVQLPAGNSKTAVATPADTAVIEPTTVKAIENPKVLH